ncbi:MAG: hypothetical protein H6Q48_2723 [Deltaproteobacteria bacterium]|jgi:hypothetical protein|nr:hypothetical protein [Deltaproteobacteria bacterium]
MITDASQNVLVFSWGIEGVESALVSQVLQTTVDNPLSTMGSFNRQFTLTQFFRPRIWIGDHLSHYLFNSRTQTSVGSAQDVTEQFRGCRLVS